MIPNDPRLIEMAKFFKALSNPDRLALLSRIVKGELCQCELVEESDKTQSTISGHLKQLVDRRILAVRQDGQRRLYRIINPKIKEILSLSQRIVMESVKDFAQQVVQFA
jgi:DNA-binding transcriptional ArsR family regulator